MPNLMEISGIDYSQGLPTPDGAGDLGQTNEPLWKSPALWIVAGLAVAAIGYLIVTKTRSRG